MNAATKHIIACGHRMLRGQSVEPWDEGTRSAVLEALLDRSDAEPAIEAQLRTASARWIGSAAFRQWLEELEKNGD